MSKVEDYRKYVGQTSTMSLELDVQGSNDLYLHTEDGTMLDLTSGISVQNLGYSNQQIVSAVKMQASKYMHTGVYGEHVQTPQVKLAEIIANDFNRRGSYQDYQVFYTNSGTESTELALKATRKNTGRYYMLAVEGGYHGRTYGAMEVGYRKEYVEGFGVHQTTKFLKRNDYDQLDDINFENYAGIILELVQGEAGGYPLQAAWVQEVSKRVREAGGKVIFDEVQTGFGRTGTLFAQEQYKIIPDFTTLGKAIGGGLPLGGVVARKGEWEKMETPAFSHVSTQAGNPVCCAAGLALVDQLGSNFLRRVREDGYSLFEAIRFIVEKRNIDKVVEVRSLGLIGAIQFVDGDSAHEFVDMMRDDFRTILGYKLNNPATVRVAPPLTLVQNGNESVVKSVISDIEAALCNLQKIQ